MNEFQQLAVISGLGVLSLFVLGRLVLRWSARHKIHQAVEQGGASVTRIRRFNGFLELGSVLEAAMSTGYVVTVVTQDGHESDLLCLVRYIPIIGFARSVEIWTNGSDNA